MTPDRAVVQVPPARWVRWVDNFTTRHGPTALHTAGGALHGAAHDGSRFAAHPPLGTAYDGAPGAADLAGAAVAGLPPDWGVLLARKGGFAVGRLSGTALVASKTGRRHVQGRTQAGGQSQQRFARRRDNQARVAHEAAADHAVRLLAGLRGPLVCGGDRTAVEEVLAHGPLAGLRRVEPWLPVPDPRRAVLEQAVADALSLRVEVCNA